MQKATTRLERLFEENQQLRERLAEAEETLEAIRSGKVDAVVVYGEDHEVVYTLKGADHTYRLLIETMNEGAVVLSDKGTVLYANRRFAEMLHKTSSALVGSDVRDFMTGADRERFWDLSRRVLEKEGLKIEVTLIDGAGGTPALVSLVPLRLEKMKTVCLVVTDLTELKRSQETQRAYAERLFRKNAELRHRAEQLARLSVELTRAEQRERKRLSKILHDGLQQHLAAAKLQLSVLAGQMAEGDIKDAALEIEAMLGESIGLSRSLSTDLSPPILHAAGLAAGLEWLARWMHDMHDFAVDLELPEQKPNLSEDLSILVFESVRELLFNAVKHAKVSRAALRLESTGDARIKIVVSDGGCGFDPFGKQLPQGEQGGLRLFSIRERIGLIGGSFEVESAPGRGARFTLIVPQAVAVAGPYPTEVPGAAAAATVAAEALQGPCVRVLLADDHTLFRDGMARLLNKEPNIEVIGQACDGRQAVDLALKLSPHVILMDISMPEIDGVQATRIIHSQAPHIRIIGLSMYEDRERSEVMRQAGAADYKTKTCPASELIAAVLSEEVKHTLRS